MKPYSMDLRIRVMDSLSNGMNKSQVCRLYKICRKTLYDWIALEAETGSIKPKTNYQKGHPPGIHDLDAFKKYVDTYPDYTQEEMAKYFCVGSSTISRTLQKIGYSRKKKSNLCRER